MNVAIAGAGIVGRLLAFELLSKGIGVTLFDSQRRDSASNCSYVAAGMLSPLSEIETAETKIFEMGVRSLPIWERVLEKIGPVYHRKSGSLMVAHPQDAAELQRIKERFEAKLPGHSLFHWKSPEELSSLEPGLAHWQRPSLYLPLEGQLDNRQVLEKLAQALTEAGVQWREDEEVLSIEERKVVSKKGTLNCDVAFDCRGLAAQDVLTDLRGVRGELVYLHAPAVNLTRPIRLVHPRYRIYIVPRPDHVYVVGASQIESDDLSPISVRTLLELLSAAYSVHPEFAEARVLSTHVHCRPAFPDNLPRVYHSSGLYRINGLYRHGFLVAPTIVNDVVLHLQNRSTEIQNSELFVTEAAS